MVGHYGELLGAVVDVAEGLRYRRATAVQERRVDIDIGRSRLPQRLDTGLVVDDAHGDGIRPSGGLVQAVTVVKRGANVVVAVTANVGIECVDQAVDGAQAVGIAIVLQLIERQDIGAGADNRLDQFALLAQELGRAAGPAGLVAHAVGVREIVSGGAGRRQVREVVQHIETGHLDLGNAIGVDGCRIRRHGPCGRG